MFISRNRAPHTSRRGMLLALTSAAAASALVVVGAGGASAAVTPIPLGTAASFAVLAGAGVTATGANVLNGDIGTFPDTSISGAGTIVVNGTNHGGDGVTQGAKDDLTNAYGVAAGQGPTSPIAADLAGTTLLPGIYNSASSVQLSGALTLDAEGNSDSLFVFQAGSDLIIGPGAVVNLINGAQACNVYWQVGSSASLDSGAAFKGTIMALTSITLNAGATVEGRLLARNGNVTLNTNTVTAPFCSVGTGGPSSSGTPTGGVQTGDGSTAVSQTQGQSSVAVAAAVGGLVIAGVLAARLRRRDGGN